MNQEFADAIKQIRRQVRSMTLGHVKSMESVVANSINATIGDPKLERSERRERVRELEKVQRSIRSRKKELKEKATTTTYPRTVLKAMRLVPRKFLGGEAAKTIPAINFRDEREAVIVTVGMATKLRQANASWVVSAILNHLDAGMVTVNPSREHPDQPDTIEIKTTWDEFCRVGRIPVGKERRRIRDALLDNQLQYIEFPDQNTKGDPVMRERLFMIYREITTKLDSRTMNLPKNRGDSLQEISLLIDYFWFRALPQLEPEESGGFLIGIPTVTRDAVGEAVKAFNEFVVGTMPWAKRIKNDPGLETFCHYVADRVDSWVTNSRNHQTRNVETIIRFTPQELIDAGVIGEMGGHSAEEREARYMTLAVLLSMVSDNNENFIPGWGRMGYENGTFTMAGEVSIQEIRGRWLSQKHLSVNKQSLLEFDA